MVICGSHQCCGPMKFRYVDPWIHTSDCGKVIKKAPNSRNQCFSFYFCLMIEGSGSVSPTNGSGFGSGRPKNIWNLRIWIRTRIRNTVQNTEKRKTRERQSNVSFQNPTLNKKEKGRQSKHMLAKSFIRLSNPILSKQEPGSIV